MVVLLSIVVVCLSLAVCVTTQADPQQETMFFWEAPDNSTYMADEAEGHVTKHFTCVAVNAYKIIWLVNGSEKQGEDRTHRSVIRSTLPYNISVGESIQVVCRAKPYNRSAPSIDSEPAVISVQTCICDSQNLPSDAELGANVSSISPITDVYYPVLLGISVVANVVLVVTVVVLAIIISLRKKQGNTGNRIRHDGADIVESDGPKRRNPQGKGASIRQRPVKGQ